MSEMIHVKLPDGSVRDVPRGTSALDIAKSISPRLADAALAAQIKPLASNGNGSGGNGHQPSAEAAGAEPASAPASSHAQAKDGTQLVDLARPLEQDAELRILTDRDPEALEVYRHSSAHLMAA
ncbi:MAG: TGS domain-containing protein, partial [Candidatus Korobacteraceae bacterium]